MFAADPAGERGESSKSHAACNKSQAAQRKALLQRACQPGWASGNRQLHGRGAEGCGVAPSLPVDHSSCSVKGWHCSQRLPDGLAHHRVPRGHLARPGHSYAAPCGECLQPWTAGSAHSSRSGCWAPRLQRGIWRQCRCRLSTHKLCGVLTFLHIVPAAACYREPRCCLALSTNRPACMQNNLQGAWGPACTRSVCTVSVACSGQAWASTRLHCSAGRHTCAG